MTPTAGSVENDTVTAMKGNMLPTSVQQIRIVTKYELLNYFRSRRFFILLIIDLIISGLLTFLVAYYRPSSFLSDSLSFYSNWWGTAITFVVVLSGIFFGGDAISGEFQNKTGYFLVGNPIRRSSIYIGKWFGALIASLIILAAYATITVANGIYYFGLSVPYQLGESMVFAFLYLIAVLGFTFFFSSLFKSSSISILVTAVLFLFAFSLIQTLVESLVKIEPWFMITYGASIISNVFISPYPTTTTVHIAGDRSPTFTMYAASIPEGIAILLVYFAITAVLGLVLFERKEFT